MPETSRGTDAEPEVADDEHLYHILNLTKSATDAQIRESHRRLSRLFHPDKHASGDARSLADPRFQEIQRAFEVLSNARSRSVYDTLGEEGLQMKLDVGPRNMTSEELHAFWRRQARQAQVEEVDRLVQARGESAVSFDCRALFGERVVAERFMRFGVPMQSTRPATMGERLSDVHFRGMSLRHSYAIPFSFSQLWKPSAVVGEEEMEEEEVATESNIQPQLGDTPSSITFTGHASASTRKGTASYGFLASLKHQISPKTSIETSLPILAPRVLKLKLVHAPAPEHFYTADVSVGTLLAPPDVAVTAGRQITKRGVAFVTFRTGSPWQLGSWGVPGYAGNYVLGFTQSPTPVDPSGYSVQLITSLQMIGVAGDYNRSFKEAGIRLKIGGSLTTAGPALNVGIQRKVTQHTRLGANLSASSAALVVRLTFSRLGQKFSLPFYVGDGFFKPIDSFVWSVCVPAAGLAAFEVLVLQPRREGRSELSMRRKRRRRAAELANMERDGREAVELMRESVTRRQELAATRSGPHASGALVIELATFGSADPAKAGERIDVTIALAAMITTTTVHGGSSLGTGTAGAGANGARGGRPVSSASEPRQTDQLVIGAGLPYARLYGFWDPAYGDKAKTLRVRYTFDKRAHYVEVKDRAALAIPSRGHLLD